MRAGFRIPLLFFVLVLLLALALACGDDGDDVTPTVSSTADEVMSLAEYLAELDVIFQRADEDSDAAQADLDRQLNDAETLEDELTVVDEYLETTIMTFSEALDAIDALRAPPEAAADPLAEFVDVATEAQQLAVDFKSDLGGVTTREAADQLVTDFNAETNRLVGRADEACLALQEIADDNDIDVHLDCSD